VTSPPDPHPSLPDKPALGRAQARPGWGRGEISGAASRTQQNRDATPRTMNGL